MLKQTLKPTIQLEDYSLAILKGGTENMDESQVSKRFNYVRKSLVGEPNGYVKLNENGKIPKEVLDTGTPKGYSICIGNTNTAIPGIVNLYKITNYHSFQTYTVRALDGTVTISKDVISYTPFNYSGNSGFYVNDEFFTVIVGSGGPSQPNLITPTQGASNLGSTLALTSTSFSSTDPRDTHESTQWQVSLDPTFTVPYVDTGFKPTDLLSYEVKDLKNKNTYHVRVRYRGTMGSVSPWSPTITFKTAERFVASVEQVKFMVAKTPTVIVSDSPDIIVEVDDYFGYSVAISNDGNTVIVGAPQDDSVGKNTGAAYIFFRTGVTWVRQAKLLAYDFQDNSYFGAGVALSQNGDIAVVGARGDETLAGAVYEFRRTGDLWVQQAKITTNEIVPYDYFGNVLSISADASTMVVGAKYSSFKKGNAYVFNRVGPVWTQIAKLSSTSKEDYFGSSVAISANGTTILIGTPYADGNVKATGCVYVYQRSGLNWENKAILKPGDDIEGMLFGSSVTLSSTGSTAVIGASAYSINGSVFGCAYVYTQSTGSWKMHTRLMATDKVSNDYFGNSVSISQNGTEVLIGAYNKELGVGAAYIFINVNDKWIQQSKIKAGDGMPGDWFAYSVGLSDFGTTAILGAYRNDKIADDSGAAYVFA